MKGLILMYILLIAFGVEAKVIAFNLGDKFMLQIQDGVNDRDASDLFESLDIELEGDPTVLEIKNFNLANGVDDIISLRCTKFLRFSKSACVIKIFKSKYSKFELNKGKIETLVEDSNGPKFSEAFFGNGVVYEDGKKSIFIKKDGLRSVFLSYSF